MAGIYIHIPFCKQACYYCNFHFSTFRKNKDAMVEAIQHELILRKDFLSGEEISTVYFGGGTPSILDTGEISGFINIISKNLGLLKSAEITLEGNPDDLSETKLRELKNIGINRLSIGTQSFDESTLHFLNRAHNSSNALKSIILAQKTGFENINIDLIFGIKPDYLPILGKDLDVIRSLGIQHISTYCLTIEEGTVFGNWNKKGKYEAVAGDESAIQYEYIMDELTGLGYDHYEISNFSMPGFESRHNTGYWRNEKYLGIGPSAHSYDRINRYANISNNSLYIRSLTEDNIPVTIDYLSKSDRINEYIMTSLRTKWGCNLSFIKQNFGIDVDSATLSYVESLRKEGFVIKNNDLILLTKKGKLLADKIASDMFVP